MKFLEELSRFDCKKTKQEQVPLPAPHCDCRSQKFWRAKNSEVWRCESCWPPVSELIVGDRWPRSREAAADDPGDTVANRFDTGDLAGQDAAESPPVLISETLATECRPICERCSGWQITERHWSDGSMTCQCATCGATVPGDQTVVQIAVTAKFRRLECRRADGSVFAKFNRRR